MQNNYITGGKETDACVLAILFAAAAASNVHQFVHVINFDSYCSCAAVRWFGEQTKLLGLLAVVM